jgi:RNA polymerase sigma-70 factor (ECF subfamily)
MTAQSQVKARPTAEQVDWETVYAEQLPRVYNFLRYRVGDGQVAEDLTSATFEKAWGARHRYRRDLAAFSTWLFTIARHVAADYYRHRRTEVSLETLRHNADANLLDETVQRRNDFAHLTALLARLPARERELIALKFGAECSNREIARLLRLSESNVGTILHRVVQRLRVQWDTRA